MTSHELVNDLKNLQDIIVHKEMSADDRLLSAYVSLDSLMEKLADDELRNAIADGNLSLFNLGPQLKQRLFPGDKRDLTTGDRLSTCGKEPSCD